MIEDFQGALLIARTKDDIQKVEAMLFIAAEFPVILKMMCELYAEIEAAINALPQVERVAYSHRLAQAQRSASYHSTPDEVHHA